MNCLKESLYSLGKKSFIPPKFGYIDGTPKLDASNNTLGCPSNNLVAVITAFAVLIFLFTSLLLSSPVNLIFFELYFSDKLFFSPLVPIISSIKFFVSIRSHICKISSTPFVCTNLPANNTFVLSES